MTESIMITIYIALIVTGIAAVALIALQVAIFIYLQNAEFNFASKIEKIKKIFVESSVVFLNPASKIKINKIKKI